MNSPKNLIFTFCLLHSLAIGQSDPKDNLILNPGFEKITRKPTKIITSHSEFDNCFEDWHTPNTMTPDVFSSGFNFNGENPYLNRQEFKNVKPIDGDVFVGLIIRPTQSEYIGTPLIRTVEPDKTYELTFNAWFNHPRIDTFDMKKWLHVVCFPKKLYQNKYRSRLIDDIPFQQDIHFDTLLPRRWIKATAIITPQTSCDHIYFGKFKYHDANTALYVLMDNFSLIEIPKNELMINTTQQADTRDSVKSLAINFNSSKRIHYSVYFNFDSDNITSIQETKLKTLIKYLQNETPDTITIKAYADEQGDEGYNMELSRRRAENVKAKLVELGYKRHLIVCMGLGINRLNLDRAKNRRADILR